MPNNEPPVGILKAEFGLFSRPNYMKDCVVRYCDKTTTALRIAERFLTEYVKVTVTICTPMASYRFELSQTEEL